MPSVSRPLDPIVGTTPTAPRRSAGTLDRVLFGLARRGRLPSPVRAAYRRVLRALAADRVMDVTTDEGLTFRCHPFENRDDFEIVAKRRLPETEERAWLADQLRPGEVFVDIGANIGSHTISLMVRLGGTLKVVAIEPNPVMRARLRDNLMLNGLTAERVDIVPVAIGPAPGEGVLIKRHPTNAGSASLKPPVDGTVADSGLVVAVQPLADVLAERRIERIGALKIDIEGFEDAALTPFFATAPRRLWPRAVMIETAMRDEWHHDVVADLLARGYRIDQTTAENTMLIAPEGTDAP